MKSALSLSVEYRRFIPWVDQRKYFKICIFLLSAKSLFS